MNTAAQVDDLIAKLKQQLEADEITLSLAIWQTALACVGWSYVYSAWEELCTPAERRKRFKMCPDKTSIKAKCQAFVNNNCHGCQWYPDDQRTRCGDCRGFQDFLFKMFGFDLYGDTVSTQWNHKENWCAKGQFGVDPAPQNVYVNIFIKNKTTGKWTHTGGYYNGSTCECANGVQYFEKMKANRWTHWAVAKCFENMEVKPVPNEPKEPATTTNYPTLRKGSRGDWVTILQQKLILRGYSCGSKGADGIYGNDTVKAVKAFQKANGLTADGIAGPKTWAAMDQAKTEPVKEMTYKVVLTGLSKGAAEEVVSRYGGTMTAE